jgi:hypothetical protein
MQLTPLPHDAAPGTKVWVRRAEPSFDNPIKAVTTETPRFFNYGGGFYRVEVHFENGENHDFALTSLAIREESSC